MDKYQWGFSQCTSAYVMALAINKFEQLSDKALKLLVVSSNHKAVSLNVRNASVAFAISLKMKYYLLKFYALQNKFSDDSRLLRSAISRGYGLPHFKNHSSFFQS